MIALVSLGGATLVIGVVLAILLIVQRRKNRSSSYDTL